MGRAWNEPARGIAGRWARTASLVYMVALAMFLGYVLLAVARPGDWMAIVLFGWGLVVAGIALVILAVAVGAAALGYGAIPRWGLVVAVIFFALAGTFGAMSPVSTSSLWLVGPVGAACLGGVAAALFALFKDDRSSPQSRDEAR